MASSTGDDITDGVDCVAEPCPRPNSAVKVERHFPTWPPSPVSASAPSPSASPTILGLQLMASALPLTFNREPNSVSIRVYSSFRARPAEAVRGVAEFSQFPLTTPVPHNSVPPSLPVVEVAIHTILYVRQIYPAEIFVRRRKYDTPVYQSRHPALNEYISGAVKAITDELALV